MMAAALHAWKNDTICMSPTSGFHHATQDESMGFCTFNGLMTTALELLQRSASKVGILDLDHHYGNGTADIIEWLSPHTPSTHFHHYTVGGDIRFNKVIAKFENRTYYAWQGGDATERWLAELPNILRQFKGCDVVLFQAGADPHINDPCHAMIGAVGALTNEQFVQRDQMVFEILRQELKLPIAWNLAGGYQVPLQKVLDIHTQTLNECLKVL
jgi:acetoin utilization deacetylase AcuC-like enzyme